MRADESFLFPLLNLSEFPLRALHRCFVTHAGGHNSFDTSCLFANRVVQVAASIQADRMMTLTRVRLTFRGASTATQATSLSIR